MLKYQIQFFADEPQEEVKQEEVKEPVKEEKKEPVGEEKKEPVKQDANEQLQAALVEIAKLKHAMDKATSEAADYKRKWKDSLSEQEKASMEKAEAQAKHEERFAELERKDKIHDFTENFMDLGYDKDLAKKAATAQVDGDTETVLAIQKEFMEKAIAEKEAEWLKTRPVIQQGGESEEDDFLKGFNSVKQYH